MLQHLPLDFAVLLRLIDERRSTGMGRLWWTGGSDCWWKQLRQMNVRSRCDRLKARMTEGEMADDTGRNRQLTTDISKRSTMTK